MRREKFYLWTEDQVRAVLTPEESGIFICAYGVREGATSRTSAPDASSSDNVLHIPEPRAKTAARFALSPDELDTLLASCRTRLSPNGSVASRRCSTTRSSSTGTAS